jgi:hypothetical protein
MKNTRQGNKKNTSSDTCQIPTGYHEKSPQKSGRCFEMPQKSRGEFPVDTVPSKYTTQISCMFLGGRIGVVVLSPTSIVCRLWSCTFHSTPLGSSWVGHLQGFFSFPKHLASSVFFFFGKIWHLANVSALVLLG